MSSPSGIWLAGRVVASALTLTVAVCGAIALGPDATVAGRGPVARIAATAEPDTDTAGRAKARPRSASVHLDDRSRLASPGSAPVCDPPWGAPVEAPISDPFRPPDRRYGPGNRGIEYDTAPGQDVLAVADGVVEFAGPVAGRPVVVIDHGAGLRSSYVNLLDGSVGRGLVGGRGQRIASADEAFHLGARRDRRYVDPADLIERRCLVVRLVPV